jgi:hypothetical protein
MIEFRYPSGRWHVPSIERGEWKLLRTRQGSWRVWRTRKGAGWDVATRRFLLATLWQAWQRRDYYPHEIYR